ncbi:MAG: polysaccharide pyruvyl transferase family protein [Candidatus Bathyarchaeota archaeon]|nr:polysaccharide pyruvyl transferase family protein [Candidatus Bathyarchaeota archaeon]
MNRRKRILISGNAFSWNYGTMSLVISAINTLDAMDKNFLYLKESVDKSNEVKKYSNIFDKGKLTIFGFNKRGLPMAFAKLILLIFYLKRLFYSDLVLDLPGEISNDISFYSQSARFLLTRLFSKDFVVYSCSLGPFKFRLTKILAKYFYNNVSSLMVREPVTEAYLSGLGVKNIHLTADHAFLMEKTYNPDLEEIGRSLMPFVGVSVKFSYDRKDSKYRKLLRQMIYFVAEELNVNVLIIPYGEEDKDLSEEIFRSIKNYKVHILRGNFLPQELKSLISKSEVFIGSRIHACISSLSSGVPTIILVPKNDHRGLGL